MKLTRFEIQLFESNIDYFCSQHILSHIEENVFVEQFESHKIAKLKNNFYPLVPFLDVENCRQKLLSPAI
jgi:hypothetical protein